MAPLTDQRTVHTKKHFVSAGLGHTVVVLENGDLVTCGMSRQYQLGLDFIKEKDRRNGKTEADLADPSDRHTPERVPALKATGEQMATAAAGSSHTLAVSKAGTVYAWGSGAFGKLGLGSMANVRIPRQVDFKRKRIARIACGPDHSAAVSESGEVLTWGAGSYGNLGHGDNTDVCAEAGGGAAGSSASPLPAAPSTRSPSLRRGASGVGVRRRRPARLRRHARPLPPAAVPQGGGAAHRGGGEHSMCITVERGQCHTWGVGDYGKLGHGDTTPQLLPRWLEYFRHTQLAWCAGGAFHSAAATEGGALYTWGGGTYGKLGQQDTMNSLTPRPCKNIPVGAHFVQVECGVFHTIALTKLGDVFAFGFNGNGRLGLAKAGTTDTALRGTPILVKELESKAAKVAEDSSAAVDDAHASTQALVKALRPKRVSQLCLGGFYSTALTDQGDLYAWGDGRHGATGLDLSRLEEKEVARPARVLGLGGARAGIVMVAAGVRHVIAVAEDGLCYSWGDGLGRLGHGDTTP